jgi:hypothetical protein
MVNMQKSQWELTQQINQERQERAQALQQQHAQQAQRDMDTALTKFRQQFPGVNDDDMGIIRQDAVPLIAGYMQQLPPTDALYRSMEVAAYANTDMRQKLEMPSPAPTAQQQSNSRKRKLGSIAGTSRSAPRDATPRTTFQSDQDMRAALGSAIADSIAGR